MVVNVAMCVVDFGEDFMTEWLHPLTVQRMVPTVLAMAATAFKAKTGCATF